MLYRQACHYNFPEPFSARVWSQSTPLSPLALKTFPQLCEAFQTVRRSPSSVQGVLVERQELYSAHCVTMEKLECLVKGLFPRSTEQFVILEAVVDDPVVTLYHCGL